MHIPYGSVSQSTDPSIMESMDLIAFISDQVKKSHVLLQPDDVKHTVALLGTYMSSSGMAQRMIRTDRPHCYSILSIGSQKWNVSHHVVCPTMASVGAVLLTCIEGATLIALQDHLVVTQQQGSEKVVLEKGVQLPLDRSFVYDVSVVDSPFDAVQLKFAHMDELAGLMANRTFSSLGTLVQGWHDPTIEEVTTKD